ncbi:PF06114 domain protein [Leptospira sp. P2653]|nr:PF06114 domain protein [Leptospira sp. P2653]
MPMYSQRIQLARESRGLSQIELAKISGITQSQLSKFESSEKSPDDEDLKKLAKALDYPIAFFNLKGEQREIHLDFFRKGKTIPVKSSRKIQAIINRTKDEFNFLLKSIDIDSVKLPSGLPSEKATEAARIIRRLWNIPSGPISNLFAVIEASSIPIFPIRFPLEDKFSGCAVLLNQVQPIIFYNSNYPSDRNRFSVAHELGHIVLHHLGESSEQNYYYEYNQNLIESQANDFASEFLMPEKEIRNDLRNLSIESLQRLKYKWRVSMAALVERAYRLSIINYNKYIYFRKEFSARKWIYSEPISIPKEETFLLKNLINIYLTDLNYSKEELASSLGLSIHEFSNIYFDKQILRLAIRK